MHCHRCNSLIKKPSKSIGTGYATREINGTEQHICYQCCAHYDKEDMRRDKKITLYLQEKTPVTRYAVKNWPGTLKFDTVSYNKSITNWGNARIDVWFKFEGHYWWGRNIGDNDLVYCKQTKRKY